MPTNPNALCASDFSFLVNHGFLDAYVRVNPEDYGKIVNAGEEFTVGAKYILGRPNILNLPFRIEPQGFAGFNIPEGLSILEVTPKTPNFSQADDTEQDLTVRAIVNKSDSDSELSPSGDAGIHYIYLNISSFQPSTNDAAAEGVERLSGSDNDIPNFIVTTFGEYVQCSWNLPIDAEGTVPVDFRVSVSTPESTGGLLYKVAGVRDYFNRLVENFTITVDLLKELLEGSTVPGVRPFNTGRSYRLRFQIKRSRPASAFNTPSALSFTTNFPLRTSARGGIVPPPRNITFGLAAYQDRGITKQRYRLQFEQPYWLGSPTGGGEFTNLWKQPYFHNTGILSHSRDLDIRGYQYRYTKDSEPVTEWSDMPIRESAIEWPTQPYASTYEIVRAFPFGNVDELPSGSYYFECRAESYEGVHGQSIYTTITIP